MFSSVKAPPSPNWRLIWRDTTFGGAARAVAWAPARSPDHSPCAGALSFQRTLRWLGRPKATAHSRSPRRPPRCRRPSEGYVPGCWSHQQAQRLRRNPPLVPSRSFRGLLMARLWDPGALAAALVGAFDHDAVPVDHIFRDCRLMTERHGRVTPLVHRHQLFGKPTKRRKPNSYKRRLTIGGLWLGEFPCHRNQFLARGNRRSFI